MRRKGVKVFCGVMAAAILVMQAPVLSAKGVMPTSAAGTENDVGKTAEDEWAAVRQESEAAESREGDIAQADEFGCRLKSWHTCYKYEYAYRTGDTSALVGEEEMAFYEGLKGYLDYAYQFDTPYEQEKAIHDHLILNCRYAHNREIDGKYNTAVWQYEGVFVHGQAVCQGYALAFQLCMDILGIESRIIYGKTTAGDHAWNVVKLDGEWYYVDATWDDPDTEGDVEYDYFNVPEWWIAQEHEIKMPLDPIGTKYSGDDVLVLTVGSEEKELNRMLRSHLGDLSPLAIYRVYLVKEDGTPWTREDVANYKPSLKFFNRQAYNSTGWWDVENGSVYCWYYQGVTTAKVFWLGMALILMAMMTPVAVILLIVLLVKRRRRKKAAPIPDMIG